MGDSLPILFAGFAAGELQPWTKRPQIRGVRVANEIRVILELQGYKSNAIAQQPNVSAILSAANKRAVGIETRISWLCKIFA